MNQLFLGLVTIISLLMISCKKDPPVYMDGATIKQYIHLSHTRNDFNPYLNETVESIDYSSFNMLWLGGDLTFHTSIDHPTMEHVNNVFDVQSTNTLWALGNHDYDNIDLVEAYTNRPPYYAFFKNGISFIILDTQDSLSHIIGDQQEFVFNVLDTIQESKHLILLHHKLIWIYGNELLEPQISTISNGGTGNCFYCTNPNNFNSEIYPKLVEIQQKGVKVMCIGGDIGNNVKEFEHITSDGIVFLASGISGTDSNNKALIFEHDITNHIIDWRFVRISEL